jgi:Fe-Mn family superoxide dismutase
MVSSVTIGLQKLPYATDALMPHLSAEAVAYHHDYHEKGYIDTVNRLLQDERLAGADLAEVAASATGPLANAAAQAWNHAFFWTCMSPKKVRPGAETTRALDESFGSVEQFKKRLRQAGLQLFGSGWIWLIQAAEHRLEILPTPNAGLRVHEEGLWPLLVCDVWEHAYYIDYRGERGRYLDAFLEIINWNRIGERLSQPRGRRSAGEGRGFAGLGPPAEAPSPRA